MFFDDLKVGQKFPGLELTVTEAHIVGFGSLTGDWAPLHFNAEQARKSQFGQRIAHGMLTCSFAMASMAPVMGSEAATHLQDVFNYHAPVFVGDTIATECEVVELTPKSKWGLVKVKLETRKQDGTIVLDGLTILGFRYKNSGSLA